SAKFNEVLQAAAEKRIAFTSYVKNEIVDKTEGAQPGLPDVLQGVPELVKGEGQTFHGLRPALGSWLADGGAEARTIRDFLGHETDALAIFYSRRADKRQ